MEEKSGYLNAFGASVASPDGLIEIHVKTCSYARISLEEAVTTYRNVTLSLPVKVLRQIKRIAARRQTSVSKLMTQALEEMAAREEEFARARARHLAWLEHAADLGTQGRLPWSRDSLHER